MWIFKRRFQLLHEGEKVCLVMPYADGHFNVFPHIGSHFPERIKLSRKDLEQYIAKHGLTSTEADAQMTIFELEEVS